MSRPETQGPPEHYYDEQESRKYTQKYTAYFGFNSTSTRIIKIQTEMAERAFELLSLPQDGVPKLILDLGCGSGLGGNAIAAAGHLWVGMDISKPMLDVAQERIKEQLSCEAEDGRESMDEDEDEDEQSDDYNSDDSYSSDDDEGADPRLCVDLFHHDMGDGTCFRPGTFDGCISISALQWLCHSNRSCENPKTRLNRLFSTLFSSLSRGARAVFQFYPETSSQIDLILGCAMKAGFTGGLVVDFPNSTKAKKYYLCLMTGPSAQLPQGREGEGNENQISIDKRSRKRQRESKNKKRAHDKGWVLGKKELARKRGETVKSDSKYTARKRRIKF